MVFFVYSDVAMLQKIFLMVSSNQSNLGKSQDKQDISLDNSMLKHFNNCQPQTPHLQPISSYTINSITWKTLHLWQYANLPESKKIIHLPSSTIHSHIRCIESNNQPKNK